MNCNCALVDLLPHRYCREQPTEQPTERSNAEAVDLSTAHLKADTHFSVLVPQTTSLGQNYPNPFNSTTTIRYALPLPEFVNIAIYNILGQEVHKMVGSWQEAGFHTARWDGRDLQGIPVSSGVYIYHIQAGKFMAAKKMAIIK